MGTSPVELPLAENVTTNVLYQANDFGKKRPTGVFSRYYGIAKSERRKYREVWRSTRESVPYSTTVTYYNWEIDDIGDNNADATKTVGKIYATYYFKFRRPRLDNIGPD